LLKKMPDILFIKTSSLGDVMHHMPALNEARTKRPDARITWVVEEAFAPLVRLHRGVDEVIEVASRRWRSVFSRSETWGEIRRFAGTLRSRRYDVVIDTQGLIRTGIITRLARGERHGYDAESIREKLATRLYDARHHVDQGLHAIERNRRLTGLALGYAPEGRPDYGLDRARLAAGSPRPYALLLHATARPEKQWPEPRWLELGGALAGSYELIIPWGTPAERERSIRLASVLPTADAPERQPLDAVTRLIAGAALVVGVDTGLLHLAAALGVPLVGIFTASEPGLTGPVGSGPIEIVGTKGATPTVPEVLEAVRRTAVL
jgi:heptosyltransferase I